MMQNTPSSTSTEVVSVLIVKYQANVFGLERLASAVSTPNNRLPAESLSAKKIGSACSRHHSKRCDVVLFWPGPIQYSVYDGQGSLSQQGTERFLSTFLPGLLSEIHVELDLG